MSIPEPVADADLMAFVNTAFRNIDMPELSSADLADIRQGLEQFGRPLRQELERRDQNEARNCLNWGPCSRHDGRMSDASCAVKEGRA